MSSSSDNQLAFTGHIANTLDALLIFEACRRGILPRTQNRLSEIERAKIKSGDVYVFGEEESKIKRWTDGRRWSPSRIMNNFLIYRELEPTEKELKKSAPLIPANTDTDSRDEVADTSSAKDKKIKREESQIQFGNDMFNEPPSSITTIAAVKVKISQIPLPGIVLQGGLIKKTISVGGLHMISYYCPADIKDGSLKTPSSVDTLASLEINHIFLLARYFRHPPQVAFGEDGTPRFVALTDDDPMPRKPGAASYPKKVKQEATSTSSSRQDELVRPSSSSTAAGRDMSGPSYFPKMEPEDDIFPEHFGPSESTSSDLPSPPPPLPMTNRRSSTGYSAGSRYRSVPGLARSLSSASESTTKAAGEILDHPPSMRPRTGSSGGGHRHEPYRMPMSRGSSNTSSSTIHPHHPSYKSPRHSFSMEYSPTMQHLRQQRTDIMYTEGIGRHLRSASLSSGLGSVSRRESMTSSPSIHAQVNAANASVTGVVAGATSPEPSLGQQSPYFGSQHSHNTYSPYMVQQRPYTSPHGGLPEQSWQGEYMGSDANTAQMYAFPPSASSAMEQQYSTEEDNQRRMSMAYSPTMQAQSPWLEHQGGDIPYTHPSLQHPREQYGLSDTGMYFMAPQQSSADFGLAATSALPPQQQHQAESVFVSGQQPYPLGEFIQPHEGGNMARNAVFQYYPPTALSSSISSQHTIPLLRTEFSPLMPASASYPSSLSSHHQQSEEASNMPYDQVPEDQQHAGLGLLAPAPPSYPHQPPHQQQQVSYPANLGKVKIDYKVVEPVTWPSYTSPKGAHHHHYHQPQHQQLQLQGVHPSELHPEQPDIS